MHESFRLPERRGDISDEGYVRRRPLASSPRPSPRPGVSYHGFMAKMTGGREFRARPILILLAFAIPLAVGSFFVLSATIDNSPRSQTYGSGVSEQCAEDTARIADERAAQVAELGANAPITGFWFAESCFE